MINAERHRHNELVTKSKRCRAEIALYKNISVQEMYDTKITIDRLDREKQKLEYNIVFEN